MMRPLAIACATAAVFASPAYAACTGAGGVPFACDAASAAPVATDLFLGGHASSTVKFTGLQTATGLFAMVPTFSGGGTANFLRADGTWAVPPSGSGATSPGGLSGQVQYNNAGAFGGLTNAQLTADISLFSPTLSGATPASGGGTANFLRADGTWATPAGTGGGTVNSVALALPPIFTVSGSPVTNSGTLTGALATETANTVFAGPGSGVAAAPTFRALVAADLPSTGVSAGSYTSANITVDNQGRITAAANGSGSAGVAGPGTSTNGFIPTWSGVGGNTLAAGLPVGLTGNSTVVETTSGGLITSSLIPAINLATSGAGGVTGTLPTGNLPTGTSGATVPLLNGANTWSGKQTHAASTTSLASINIPQGVAPTTPVNGDVWTTSAGLYVQIAGVTVGPLSTGGGSSSTPVTTVATSGASQTLSFASSGNKAYDVTLSANCVFSLSGGTAGQLQTVTLIDRTGAGGFSTTLPSGVKWPGGTAPTPSTVAGQINTFSFTTSDGGTTVIGGYSVANQ